MAKGKRSLLRKAYQALGVTIVFYGLYQSILIASWVRDGSAAISYGIIGILIALCVTGGSGLLMVFFHPYDLFHANAFTLANLVRRKQRRPSFAERIGVDDDDE